MNIQSLQEEDLEYLKELQPSDWDDITVPHQTYLNSPFCNPIKVMVDDRLAGIGTAITHDDTAWLAHIVVHPLYRNKGIGKIITHALIDRIDRQKYETIYLIATDLGFPVYQRAGFQTDNRYAHFTRQREFAATPASSSIIAFKEVYSNDVLALDQYVSGEGRKEKIIEYMETSLLYVSANTVAGVYFPQLGNGLIIADEPEAGIELMKLRLEERDFAILPLENTAGLQFLTENNFTQVRTSTRMYLGKKRTWRPYCLYNRISGQFG